MMTRFTTSLLLVVFSWAQTNVPSPLTVCEVLSRLSFYQGKRVTIRGELLGGDEAIILVGDRCRPLVTAGYRWPSPSPIALTYSPRRGGESPVVTEQLDPTALKAAGPRAKIYVTVTGRLDARDHYEMVQRGDGKVVPNGFGHQAACPAQIVYDEIKDIAIVPDGR